MIKVKTLILGAGKYERLPGAEHHDILPFEGIDYRFDLNKKWVMDECGTPFPESHYDHIGACHVVEHLDSLIHFMDNCHRILKPDGVLIIETPNAGMNYDLTNADPTHKHAFRPHSFINYFTPEGIEKFGYTDKPWKLDVSTFKLEVDNDCIRVIATPIK